MRKPEDVKAAYLAEVGKLLERAYEDRAIETTVSEDSISIRLTAPRGAADEETVTRIGEIQP